MFAVEVPFQEDLSRHMLLPAAISAAAGYVTFAALAGTEPILPVAGQAPFNLVVAGLLARVLVALVRRAGQLPTPGHPLVRALAAGAVLAGVVVVGHQLSSEPLMLGPGYHALGRVLDPHRSVLAIVALGTLRVVGTTAAVGGGGVGGLFIPLVTRPTPPCFPSSAWPPSSAPATGCRWPRWYSSPSSPDDPASSCRAHRRRRGPARDGPVSISPYQLAGRFGQADR